MTIEQIRDICLSYPDTTEDIKWEHNLCFCVGGKIFCILSLDDEPVRASFKVEPEEFGELTERNGFIPAPYLARAKWVTATSLTLMKANEWKERLETSYGLIKNKSRKVKK